MIFLPWRDANRNMKYASSDARFAESSIQEVRIQPDCYVDRRLVWKWKKR